MTPKLIRIVPLALLAVMLFPTLAAAAKPDTPETGRDIILSRKLGNCLACHSIPGLGKDNVLPGNLGPTLQNMKSMFSSKKQLRAHIWDETKFNPNTSMPPFGKHKILTDQQIDKVVDFLYGL
jgi:sulfur-oxidizing protein SoxX